MSKFSTELTKAMTWLGTKPDTYFIGQAVEYEGTAMTKTLEFVPKEKLKELPVFENTQTGMALGLSLYGFVPISIYPRWNFLLLGIDQLINHIDKFPLFSKKRNKVIIRTGIGSESPLHPQHQHVGDYTEAVRAMCKTTEVIRLDTPEMVWPAYEKAYYREDGKSTIIVEWGDSYNDEWKVGDYKS